MITNTLIILRMANAQKDTMRQIFESFDENRSVWSIAVACIAFLDALMSLAAVSSSPAYSWPTFVPRKDSPILHITEGRHPMLEETMSQRGDAFIPNSIYIGGQLGMMTPGLNDDSTNDYVPRLMLLSGPNMGGKSTLLRQVCLITIMAQLGCAVPATNCVLTPVDR